MILLDVFCVVVILFFVIRGLRRGLLNSLFWLAGFVCAGFMAFHLHGVAGRMVANLVGFGPTLFPLVAFVVIFFLVMGAFLFVGRMTTEAARTLRMSAMNRLLGAVFGAGVGILVTGTVVYVMRSGFAQVGKGAAIDGTVVARPVMDIAVALLGAFAS